MKTRGHRTGRGVRALEKTLAAVRRRLDESLLTETLQLLLLREGVRLDLFKDKIAEVLSAVVGQPSEFRRERFLRQECARNAKRLRKSRFLDGSERLRSLRTRIEGLAKLLERRAQGIERCRQKLPLLRPDGTVRPGWLEVREYLLHEQSDRRYVYDLAVLNLFAILRRLTKKHRRGQAVLFETIAFILQSVGVLRENAEEPDEAIRKRFDRANRWPVGIKGPPPVDFCEYQLFGLDPRFPARPFALPSTSYAIATATPSRQLLPPVSPDR